VARVLPCLIAGLRYNRRVIGCDRESNYIQIAKERISGFFNGTLRIRPLGKPVYVATGREKVSQLPDEWKSKQVGEGE